MQLSAALVGLLWAGLPTPNPTQGPLGPETRFGLGLHSPIPRAIFDLQPLLSSWFTPLRVAQAHPWTQVLALVSCFWASAIQPLLGDAVHTQVAMVGQLFRVLAPGRPSDPVLGCLTRPRKGQNFEIGAIYFWVLQPPVKGLSDQGGSRTKWPKNPF